MVHVQSTNSIPAVLKVEEAAAYLRIGRSAAYQGVRSGTIPSVRVGKLYRIPRVMLLEFLGGADAEQGAASDAQLINKADEKHVV